ncbi:MAG: hypothetical protein SFX74_13285 [Fimbriimonadaceae bacterium]|nr:hypothetical protein [Fimbriimonadaceae bacterium]
MNRACLPMLLLTIALARAQDPAPSYTFRTVPDKKVAAIYRVEFVTGEITVTTQLSSKVTEVGEDGTYIVEQTVLDGLAKSSFGELAIPKDTTRVTYRPNGQPIGYVGPAASGAALRFGILNALLAPDAPVASGASWTVEVKPDEKLGTRAAKASYKLIGTEKLDSTDALKVEAEVVESGDDGASCKATYWVDPTSFRVLKVTGEWIRLTIPGSTTPMNAKFSTALIEVKPLDGKSMGLSAQPAPARRDIVR